MEGVRWWGEGVEGVRRRGEGLEGLGGSREVVVVLGPGVVGVEHPGETFSHFISAIAITAKETLKVPLPP